MCEINTIYKLDCLEFLKLVEDNSVDLAVIDPPYNMIKAKWDTFPSHLGGLSHAKITQNRNKNVITARDGDNLVLSDLDDNKIEIKFNKNALYLAKLIPLIIEYNKSLLDSYLSEFNIIENE